MFAYRKNNLVTFVLFFDHGISRWLGVDVLSIVYQRWLTYACVFINV